MNPEERLLDAVRPSRVDGSSGSPLVRTGVPIPVLSAFARSVTAGRPVNGYFVANFCIPCPPIGTEAP